MILNRKIGGALRMRNLVSVWFCGSSPVAPQDSIAPRMSIYHQASFHLKTTSLLPPHNQGRGSVHRNIHSFFLVTGGFISSMQVEVTPNRCSLEPNGHFTEHIWIGIRTIWLTEAAQMYVKASISAAFEGAILLPQDSRSSFCPKWFFCF